MRFSKLLLTTTLVTSLLHSAIPLNPDKVLAFPIASKGINRITIEGDFIDNVFVYPESLGSSVVLHPKGHVYIPGNKDLAELDIGILTRSGRVQDLHLTFTQMKARPLVFVASSRENNPPGTVNQPSGELSRILHTCVRGDAPSTYPDITKQIPAKTVSRRHAGGDLTFTRAYQATRYYRVFVYEFKAGKDMRLVAASFKTPQDAAVVASTSHVKRRQKAQIYIVQHQSNHN